MATPARERRPLPTQSKERAIKIVDRGSVGALASNVDLLKIGRQRQPRLGAREAGIVTWVPLHGRAAPVAADVEMRHVLLEWIANTLGRDGNLRHCDLVAVIHGGSSAQGEQKHAGHACLVAP